MGNAAPLGEFEQLILLAILRLGYEAYGVTIRHEIEECTGRSVSRGAVYTTLDRLEDKGLLSSAKADSPGPRTGMVRRYFAVEPDGLEALAAAGSALRTMWSGLEPMLGDL